MNTKILPLLALLSVAVAYPTSYISGEPHNRQFYYYNQPPTGHVVNRNYNYLPYNEIPYGNPNNLDYRYGRIGYGGLYDTSLYNGQYDGNTQPGYGYGQNYYIRYDDSNAPSEIRYPKPEYLTKNDIDLSGFKLHHQHHPNKDRVGLKPGHDGGLHGVSFGNDGYGT